MPPPARLATAANCTGRGQPAAAVGGAGEQPAVREGRVRRSAGACGAAGAEVS